MKIDYHNKLLTEIKLIIVIFPKVAHLVSIIG